MGAGRGKGGEGGGMWRALDLKWEKLVPGRVNKMRFKHIYSTF